MDFGTLIILVYFLPKANIFYNMNLKFLPLELRQAIDCLNINYLTEIRIRRGQPVIIEYHGEYKYINSYGYSVSPNGAIVVYNVDGLLNSALSDGIYAYSEQLKSAFVTLDGGVRIGVAGEYVTDRGKVTAVRCITSLNIRIPHDINGCAHDLYMSTLSNGLKNILIFSPPGLGKTTMLRDLARHLGKNHNVLVFDERNEIAAADSDGDGYRLGERCDVIRGGDKLTAFPCAIRVMKPNVIITDELYGESDIRAVKYAVDCGITVCASTHVTNNSILKDMPFDYYCRLTGIGDRAVIYDKNFDIVRDNCCDNNSRSVAVGRKEETGTGVHRIV